MPEVWTVTWFCLALADPTCARLEGSTGNIQFEENYLCELMGWWGQEYYRTKLGIPLAYTCTLVGDTYRPTPRPKGLQ